MILIIAFICALVLMAIQRFIYARFWSKGLSVETTYKYTELEAGESNELIEIITNNKRLPLPMLHVKFDTPKSFIFENEANSSVSDNYYRDDVFTVMGHQRIKRTLKFTCEKRGCYYMHDTNITSSDLFLSLILTGKRINNSIIHVFPKKLDLKFFDIPFQTISGDFISQRTLVEDPFEFKGIREYQPYDGIKKINQKSTAKNNKLMVNTYFMTSSQEVIILLNVNMQAYKSDSRLVEGIISLASSIAERFVSIGVPVGLYTNGADIYTGDQLIIESGSGSKHMFRIDTALARVDVSKETYDFSSVLSNTFKHISSNAYYIVISNDRRDNIRNVYENAKKSGLASYFIVPELASLDVQENITDMIKWNIEY